MIELINGKILLDDGCEIREYYTEKGNLRAFVYDECTQSLMYIDKRKRNELGLKYLKFYDLPMYLNPCGTDYLMLGGGVFSYAHHYINNFKNKRMDVVEINKKCIEYAKKYFYLDKLIENNEGRLSIIIDNAIKYISYCKKQYDYILIDLFDGKEPITEIYNEENLNNLKKCLKRDGIIIVNYIIFSNKNNEYLKKLLQITNDYKIVSNKESFNSYLNIGNIIIILSNSEINIPNSYEYLELDEILYKQ